MVNLSFSQADADGYVESAISAFRASRRLSSEERTRLAPSNAHRSPWRCRTYRRFVWVLLNSLTRLVQRICRHPIRHSPGLRCRLHQNDRLQGSAFALMVADVNASNCSRTSPSWQQEHKAKVQQTRIANPDHQPPTGLRYPFKSPCTCRRSIPNSRRLQLDTPVPFG